MRYRLSVAWHLRHDPWEAVDFLFGCRIRWICDRYERSLGVSPSELNKTAG